MANSVVTQVLEDGPKFAVVKAVINVDSSDLAETVIADPALLAADALTGLYLALAIYDVIYSVQTAGNCALRLQWKATANTDALTLVGFGRLPFEDVGGPIKNDSGAGKNGKLVAVTTGWAATNVLIATVYLKLLKTSA